MSLFISEKIFIEKKLKDLNIKYRKNIHFEAFGTSEPKVGFKKKLDVVPKKNKDQIVSTIAVETSEILKVKKISEYKYIIWTKYAKYTVFIVSYDFTYALKLHFKEKNNFSNFLEKGFSFYSDLF